MPIFENYPVQSRIYAWTPDEGFSMHPTFLQVVGGEGGGGNSGRIETPPAGDRT